MRPEEVVDILRTLLTSEDVDERGRRCASYQRRCRQRQKNQDVFEDEDVGDDVCSWRWCLVRSI